MNNLLIKIIIIILTPLLLSSCDKTPKPSPIDYNNLPEYFECYINGKYFTYSNGDAFMQNPDGLFATSNGFWIDISGKSKGGGSIASGVNFQINKSNISSLSIINLGDISSEGTADVGTFKDFPNERLQTDSFNTGQITFTKNTPTLIEGTFNFKAKAQQGGFVADITQGKFKIKI